MFGNVSCYNMVAGVAKKRAGVCQCAKVAKLVIPSALQCLERGLADNSSCNVSLSMAAGMLISWRGFSKVTWACAQVQLLHPNCVLGTLRPTCST